MTKRITALLLAVIIPITLLFSGCGKRLTQKEYYDGLQRGFNAYIAALDDIETVRADVTSSQEIMLEQTKATKVCENAEKALAAFEEMNPPEKFAEKHKDLLNAVALEKKYVAATRQVLTAKTPAEIEEYATEAQNVFALVPEEQQFAMVYAKLILEAKAAAES